MALPPQRPGSTRPGSTADELEASRDKHASEQLAEFTTALEEELEELKAKYEMFFLGVERADPARRREELKREIGRLMGQFTRNAALRFRIQALHARFLSYERLWTRTAQQKEAGTYRRDVLRARARAAKEAAKASAAPPTPAAPSPPATDAPRPAVATPPPTASFALGTDRLKSIYDEYVAAKRACNEDVTGLTPEALGKSLGRQLPGLLQKLKSRGVDFRVVVKDGRAILRAVPKG